MCRTDIKYDIVFWAYGYIETERFLPLMVSLNKRGIRTLLFYQYYNFKNNIAPAQLRLIKRYNLNILDYSYFLKNNLFLRLVSAIIYIFKNIIKYTFLYNKFKGLLYKLLQCVINEKLIKNIIMELNPKISFFDTISLVSYVKYPYGSYYIKKISDEMKIKTLCIVHGGTGYLLKREWGKPMNFDRFYVPNTYEQERFSFMRTDKNADVLSLGDPRFDINWKKEIKNIFSADIEKKMEHANKVEYKFKILYLCPNLEQINAEDAKYKNLTDVVKIAKDLREIFLIIKPHPRYRGENKIKKIMKNNNFHDFFIIGDEPLICYLEHVDYIVTLSTSALQDALPEYYRKVVIYDNFLESVDMENIFKKDFFMYLNTYQQLFNFFKYKAEKNKTQLINDVEYKNVRGFSKKWVAGGKELDTPINDITEDICQELKRMAR